MNAHFDPNASYLIINWNDLEHAWRKFSHPSQAILIEDCLQTLKTLSRTQSVKETACTLVMITGYLTSEDGARSQDG